MTKTIATVIILAGLAAGCSGRDQDIRSTCGDPSVPGVVVQPPGIDLQIRDPYGVGQALGTTATVTRGTAAPERTEVRDTLDILAAFNVSGTFTVRVSRPFYKDAAISPIIVLPAGCGVRTTVVPVNLELATGAPPLRAIAVIGGDFLYAPGVQVHLKAHFDADPQVSRAVTWSVSDATLASIDANGVVTAKCSRTGGSVVVTAKTVADPAVTASTTLGVGTAQSCP